MNDCEEYLDEFAERAPYSSPERTNEDEHLSINNEERCWNLVVGEDSVSSYRAYLRKYPDGPHLRLARRKIVWKCLSLMLCVLSAFAFLILFYLLVLAVYEHFAMLISNR